MSAFMKCKMKETFPKFCEVLKCRYHYKWELIKDSHYRCSDTFIDFCPLLAIIMHGYDIHDGLSTGIEEPLLIMSAFIKYVNSDISVLTKQD
jgi:hypothetical protein